MARNITVKKIKEVVECVCGFNSVEDYEQQIRWVDLKGFSLKKYRDTGERFFLIKISNKVCNCDN